MFHYAASHFASSANACCPNAVITKIAPQWRPDVHSVMVKRWAPVRVETNSVTITGGYNPNVEPAKSISYCVDGKIMLFVEMDKNAKWFTKAVGGITGTDKGCLKLVTTNEMVRAAWTAATADAGPTTAVAAAADEAAACGDVDPMDAMDELPAASTPQKKQPKRQKTPQKKQAPDRAEVRELVVPIKPLCAGGSAGDTTTICVYRQPFAHKVRNRRLYLRTDCVQWFISYAAAEYEHQGVEAFDPAATLETSANCTEVAGLQLTYDFNTKGWRATFVEGPHQGVIIRFLPSELGPNVWNMLKAHGRVEGYWSVANAHQRRHAAKAFVLMWCAALLRNEESDFEQCVERDVRYREELEERKQFKRECGGTAVADSHVDDDDESNETVQDAEGDEEDAEGDEGK